MKSFISSDKNLYYEAPDRIGLSDIEVPRRPTPSHTFINGQWVDQNFLQAMPLQAMQAPQIPINPAQSNLSDLVNVIKQLQTMNTTSQAAQILPVSTHTIDKKDANSFMGDKFTWKDLITILYFAGGIVGLWMHMNERIIILEQKVVAIEKGSAELQGSFKDFTVKNENQLKGIDSKISDLQQMVISRIAHPSSK